MRLVEHYPETLRDIYDKIDEVIIAAEAKPGCMDIALHVTEWIREHWSRRTLIPAWWGCAEVKPDTDDTDEILPGVEIQVDPLRTMRGRELRDVVLGILLTDPNAIVSRPCHLATDIAALVENEWSRIQVYIPKAAAVDRAIRDARIYADFNGFSTIDRVVTVHNLSQSSIYEVFRRLQKDKDAREQPLLPGM